MAWIGLIELLERRQHRRAGRNRFLLTVGGNIRRVSVRAFFFLFFFLLWCLWRHSFCVCRDTLLLSLETHCLWKHHPCLGRHSKPSVIVFLDSDLDTFRCHDVPLF